MDSFGLNYFQGEVTMTNPERRRWLDLDLDLNYPLPPQMRAFDFSLGLSSYNNDVSRQVQVANASVQVLDDEEVAVISPRASRAFVQARQSAERNHSHGKRAMAREATGTPRRSSAAATLCDNCKIRVPDDYQPCSKPGSSNKKGRHVRMIEESPHHIPSPAESIFSCPVCMGALTEPTSTKCGHIFCKECIQRSLKSLHNKCPTCRQKVGKRGIFRVYLPTTN